MDQALVKQAWERVSNTVREAGDTSKIYMNGYEDRAEALKHVYLLTLLLPLCDIYFSFWTGTCSWTGLCLLP